jgi:hypothetical protein
MRAHFAPQAEIDLEEVGDYIALDNPRRAASFTAIRVAWLPKYLDPFGICLACACEAVWLLSGGAAKA